MTDTEIQSIPSSGNSTPESGTPAPATPTPPLPVAEVAQEKMIPQSKVNEIVGRTKHETAEQVRREFQATQQSVPVTQGPLPVQTATNLDEHARIRAVLMEEVQKAHQEQRNQEDQARGQEFANNFIARVKASEERFPNLVERLARLNIAGPAAFPILPLIDRLENATDVLNECANNPHKLQELINNYRDLSPQIAEENLHKLANSLKRNETAKKTQFPNDPLSSITPSLTGIDDGVRTISDKRRNPLLQG